MSSRSGAVIAVTGEDDRYRSVTDYGARAARTSGARLILYDIDAAGLQAPLPTIWSAEGTQETFESGLLTAPMLEGVGRQKVADQVRHYEAEGIAAYGWLPGNSNVATLADYAESQQATLIVVPEHSDHRSIVDRFRGRDTSDLEQQTDVEVVVVGDDEAAAG